jgi:LacI family transcriptional regulator
LTIANPGQAAPTAPGGPEGPAANVTIYEVAARAGVSIATVSHAFNRPDRVSESTRRRVLASADQLGFQPRGRSLAGHSAPTVKRVAVVGPMARHDTYAQRLLGIMRQAQADFIDIVAVDNSETPTPLVVDALPVRSRIDGLIVMGGAPSDELAENLASRRIRTLLLDRTAPGFPSVTVDDQAGGRMVAEHLLGLGCRSAVLVSQPPAGKAPVTSGELRFRAFAQTLREAGAPEQVGWSVAADTFEGGREAARSLAEGELPDAVFAVHDRVAAGLVAQFAALGVRVPEQVTVVGYDDVEIAAWYGLTTVRQPFAQSGAVALQTLRAHVLDPGLPLASVVLQPTLVPRASTVGAPEGEEAL